MSIRTKNTKRNIMASYLLMILQMVFQFLSRSLIIQTLGEEYLGLSSLFTSILQVLNIAELGFTSSVVYFMYEPLAKKDKNEVCALLAYLRKIYKIVGLTILISGIAITPLIPLVIKGDVPKDINVYFFYILYLINTSISYFLFAHKTALLTALQRIDLTKIVNSVVVMVQYPLQIIVLLIFKNYYLFVVTMILGTASTNLFTAYISKKVFPQYECKGRISNDKKADIISKVKGLMICNISAVTYTTLDSIIISSFIGLQSVAVYNNYIVIYSAVASIITVIRNSMQSSVGDSVASETIEKNYNNLELWQFLFSIIGTWCVVCLISLYQPFMRFWMGEEMLLPMIDVILISSWLLVIAVQHPFYLYLTGNGLWNEMKWVYLFSTFFDLCMNLILGKYIGITGIIIASLLSCVISGTFWQCNIIFKYYFKRSAKKYIIRQFIYFGIASFIAVITYYICSFVESTGVIELVAKAIICTLLSLIMMVIIYRKTPYYLQAKDLLKRAIQK